jgi:hypothetical protein
MLKLEEIVKSWATSMNPTKKQQQIADQRATICNTCDFKKYNDVLDFYYCGSCGCPLKGKIHSPVEKACPENKWPV